MAAKAPDVWASALAFVSKSKRAAICLTLVSSGLLGGNYAKQFMVPFDRYASAVCLGAAAAGFIGLLVIAGRSFFSKDD